MAIPEEAPSEPIRLPTNDGEQTKGKGKRKAFSSVRRELNEKESSSTAALKLALDDIDRLEEEKSELAGYRSRFHEADKKCAILDQKLSFNTAQEILSGACLAVGSAAVGYAPAAWLHQPSGYIFLALGIILIVGGIAAKAIKL